MSDLDPKLVRTWFDVLYVAMPGLLHISATDKWAGRAFEDRDEAAAYVAELDADKPEGIYLRCTTLRQRPAKGRGTARDSLALPGLWADVDIAGPGHSHDVCGDACTDGHQHITRPLPPDTEAARKVVEASGLPDPTLWVHSGGGLYPWWLLDRHIEIGEDNIAAAEVMSARWQTVLGRSAAALGWHYGTGVGDLPRILRIPGTVNRKEGLARPCQIVDAQLRRFSADELREGLAAGLERHPDPAPPAVVPVQRRLEVVRAPGHVTPNDDFEARVAWDDQMLLGGAGWRIAKGHPGSYCEWIRPGEKKTAGISATTGLDPARDRMFVFSDSAGLPEREEMTKPYVYALLHHRGDTRAATRDLARLGFGTPCERTEQRADHAKPTSTPHQADDPEAPRAVMRTWDDLGNAKRLMDQHGHNLRWLTDANQWAAYTGTHWTVERASSIAWQRAREVVEAMPELEAPLYDDEPGDPNKKGEDGPSQRDAFLAFAKNQRFRPHLTALIDVARSEPDLWAEMSQFDRDEWVLNCANGVLNLRTGELTPHRSSLMLMHQTGVAYNPNATAPNWEKFLRRVMPDSSRFDYLRRIAGYTLTGSIEEQAIFVHHGVGANGKSVFLKVIRAIFGSYGQSVPRSTLLAKASDGGIPNDVARMQGRRLLVTSETSAGKRFDDELVKQLTGGEEISARYMRGEYFDFTPVGKIHLMTNHLPAIGGGHGIARRLQDIGWDTVIPEAEQDKKLAERIIATELPGVLAWAVRGCAEWQSRGIDIPESVKAKTAEHIFQSDPLAAWLEARTGKAADVETETRLLYADYAEEARQGNSRPMTEMSFSEALVERGYARGKDTKTRRSVIVGLRLLPRVVESGDWLAGGGNRAFN